MARGLSAGGQHPSPSVIQITATPDDLKGLNHRCGGRRPPRTKLWPPTGLLQEAGGLPGLRRANSPPALKTVGGQLRSLAFSATYGGRDRTNLLSASKRINGLTRGRWVEIQQLLHPVASSHLREPTQAGRFHRMPTDTQPRQKPGQTRPLLEELSICAWHPHDGINRFYTATGNRNDGQRQHK